MIFIRCYYLVSTCDGWKMQCELILPRNKIKGEIAERYFLLNFVYTKPVLSTVNLEFFFSINFRILFHLEQSQFNEGLGGEIEIKTRMVKTTCIISKKHLLDEC